MATKAKLWRRMALGLALSASVLVPGAVWAVGTLDQQQTDVPVAVSAIRGPLFNNGVGVASGGQTFTPTLSGALDQVDLYLEHSSIVTNHVGLTVEVRDVVADVPGANVLATASVSPESVPAANSGGGWVTAPLAVPATVAAGTQYSIVVYTGGESNYRWYGSQANPYSGGSQSLSLSSPPSTWTLDPNDDYAFKTYITPAPDTTAPTVTITKKADQADPTSTDPIDFTVVFSEPVTGFIDNDIELSGTAGAVAATVTGSGTTYNVAVSGMNASGTVIAKVKEGAAIDGANNQSTASGTASVAFEPDTTAPTVTINQAPGQNDPTLTEPVRFVVKFSEPVTGFGTGSEDVPLSGTAVDPTTGWSIESGEHGDSEYIIAVEGLTAPGTVIATVKADAASDNNQNRNTASTSTDNSVYFGTPPVPPVTCGGKTATLKGTAGNDTLTGTAGPDVIAGLGGNDKITGVAGNDLICGGGGNDTLDGGSGTDKLEGGAGGDNIIGGSGSSDRCDGGSGTDSGGSGCETKVSLP